MTADSWTGLWLLLLTFSGVAILSRSILNGLVTVAFLQLVVAMIVKVTGVPVVPLFLAAHLLFWMYVCGLANSHSR